MNREKMRIIVLSILSFFTMVSQAQIVPDDLVWTSQSSNSSESMPCGGGSIGMNVWVENGELYLYVNRSGAFDENSSILKQGRFRFRFSPSLDLGQFRQTLKVNDGYVTVADGKTQIKIWADVFHPVVHVNIRGQEKLSVTACYENWRTEDHAVSKDESFQTSFKFGEYKGLTTHHDDIEATDNAITFMHHNQDSTVFDVSVSQQGLSKVKPLMDNPMAGLTFGGRMTAPNIRYVGKYHGTYIDTPFTGWEYQTLTPQKNIDFQITLANHQGSVEEWKELLSQTERQVNLKKDEKASIAWWNEYWTRSWIVAEGEAAQYTTNYTLFRYMMGCNAMGEWPTKFNGGLFTFDPSLVFDYSKFTPDYRQWGGGTHTAQNQRLLYWPMLKSGDFEMMDQQLDYYLKTLHNAELRSLAYWDHAGACFEEQIDPFGLPAYGDYDYGYNRSEKLSADKMNNAWLEYTWDTVLEFCQMAFDREDYSGIEATKYIPLVCSSLDFFDEHYRYLARNRGITETDADGKLVLYPGSGAETYKMAYNATSTCIALATVTKSLIRWMQRHAADTAQIAKYQRFLATIPDISYREIDGHKVISPAVVWSRVNNTEPTQLYPVYPWKMFGVGHDNLDIALNTWKYDPFVKETEGYHSWRQSLIWAACLGQTDDAVKWLRLKMANGPHRFPAFFGPGIDWTPDHNWGGSGMIGMQEMLVQEAEGKIYLFPAWPKDWSVTFKLHLSQQTTIEVELHNGEIKKLEVFPENRKKDIINCLINPICDK